jgi:hypothetical protein
MEFDPSRLDRCADGSCRTRSVELWSDQTAYAYPALVVDDAGTLGGVVLYGGGSYMPGCAAIAGLDPADPSEPWIQPIGVGASTAGLPKARWGDYLGAAIDSDGTTFAGACATVHPRGVNEVHLVRFAVEP